MRFSPALRRALRFGRDEDGSMVVFSLFVFLTMLLVAGMAVDLMRFESTRSRLQATQDGAVLAATDLDQIYANGRTPRAVVENRFQIAGLLDELRSINVVETVNSRTVSATADLAMNTFFMDLLGVPKLVVPAAARATEAVRDIEIALVLDVSGSMVQNNSPKLANMQTAARGFVQTVLQNDTQGRISIGIVPFNGQVNLGPLPAQSGQTTLASWYTGTYDRVPPNYGAAFNHVGCVDLPGSVYSTQTIARGQSMPATTLADTYSWASGLADNNGDRLPDTVPNTFSTPGASGNRPVASNMWCPPTDGAGTSTAGNVVRLPSNSISTLHGQIDGLRGVGATSINAGMRWGMTLLDPNAQAMFGDLGVPFTGRPYAYGSANTLKVIVLMTDGENFPEERVNDGFRSGTSPIWRATDGNYSVFHLSKVVSTNATTTCNSRPFYVPHLNAWHSRPWNGTAPANAECYVPNALTPGATRLSWPEVWTALRMSWVAWQLYARPLALSSDLAPPSPARTDRRAAFIAQMNLFRSVTDAPGTVPAGTTPTMDAQLAQMCARARDNGIIVYGVAFEAPTRGRDVIRACSSTEAYFFITQGAQIIGTFQSIAAQINQLRLDQ